MKERLGLWLILDLFVRIITLTVIVRILAKTMNGVILTIFVGLFVLWAFRPCYLALKNFKLSEKKINWRTKI